MTNAQKYTLERKLFPGVTVDSKLPHETTSTLIAWGLDYHRGKLGAHELLCALRTTKGVNVTDSWRLPPASATVAESVEGKDRPKDLLDQFDEQLEIKPEDQPVPGIKPETLEAINDLAREVRTAIEKSLATPLSLFDKSAVRSIADGAASNVMPYVSAALEAALAKAPAPAPFAPIPGKSPDGYYWPAIGDDAARILMAGQNVFLAGPAGCGKTRLGRALAERLGNQYHYHSFSAGQSPAALIGRTVLEEGKTRFELSPLARALTHTPTDDAPAYLVLLDEYHTADPEIAMLFNGALEPGERTLTTPLGILPVTARIIAAGNTVGRSESRQYTGAQRLDASTLSRFVVLRMEYDNAIDRNLLTDIPEADRKAILDGLRTVRDAVRRSGSPYDVGHRATLSARALVSQGIPGARAIAMVLVNPLEQTEVARLGLDNMALAAQA